MFYKIEHIPDEQTMQAVVDKLLPLVPFARCEKALRYKHLHGQYTCLRTWQLLYSLLIEHAWLPADFPMAELTYTEDANGKPRLAVSPSIHFSISHTKTAIAVAIARRPIGIDIETIVPDKRLEPTFLNYTMSPNEQRAIQSAENPALAFTELWTQKEALFKAIGSGIDMHLLASVLEKDATASSDTTIIPAHTLVTHRADDYACSISMLIDDRQPVT